MPRRFIFSAFTFATLLATHPALAQVDAPLKDRPPIPGAPTGVTAFVDVTVVPMDTERVLSHQTVLVKGGWITALGPSSQVHVPAGATRIDGRQKYLLPGLADMHTHLGTILSDTSSGERELFIWLARGVTTIRNMDMDPGMHQDRSLRLKSLVATGKIPGPRMYVAAPDPFPIPGTWPKDLNALVVEYKAAGYDLIKVYDHFHFASDSAHILTRAIFDSLAVAAHRVGLPLAGHVASREVGLIGALEAPYMSLEHLDGYLDYLTPSTVESKSTKDTQAVEHVDTTKIPEILAATRRAGVWVCPTLATAEIGAAYKGSNGLAKIIGRYLGKTLVLRRKLVKSMQDSGVGLLLGADAPAGGILQPGVSINQELEALVRAGLTPYQALATGTRNVATFFSTMNETGTVAVGKRADIVLVNRDPLANISNMTQISGVMVGGRWFERSELDRRLANIEIAGP